jgi:hypothetical protein
VLVVDNECLIAAEFEDEIAMQGAEIVGPVLTLDEAYSLNGNMQVDAVLDIVLRNTTVYVLAESPCNAS